MLNNMDLFTGSDSKPALFKEDIRIFPGHEYAETNLKFALDVFGDIESDQKEIVKMYLEKFRENHHREDKVPSVPSTLHNERQYNVFMCCRSEWLQKLIKVYDPVLLMHILREWKNDKKKPGTHIFSQQYLSHNIGM